MDVVRQGAEARAGRTVAAILILLLVGWIGSLQGWIFEKGGIYKIVSEALQVAISLFSGWIGWRLWARHTALISRYWWPLYGGLIGLGCVLGIVGKTVGLPQNLTFAVGNTVAMLASPAPLLVGLVVEQILGRGAERRNG
jgi:hypothetical protein